MIPFKICVTHIGIATAHRRHTGYVCRVVSLVWNDSDNPVAALAVRECELCREGRIYPPEGFADEASANPPDPGLPCQSCGGKGYTTMARTVDGEGWQEFGLPPCNRVAVVPLKEAT